MEEWIKGIVSADQTGFAFFGAVFLIGLLAAVSSCCALPVIGAVVGYAGSREQQQSRRELILIGLFFMLGTTLSLAVIGVLSGFLGHMISSSFGRYWQFLFGIMLVFFGLVSLNLFHVKIPKLTPGFGAFGTSIAGAILYGLVLGGATTACTVGCNPLLPIVIGATAINGSIAMSTLTFVIFGLGFSFPLAAGLIGLSFGLQGLSRITQQVMPAVRIVAGVLLIGTGFYLLVTL